MQIISMVICIFFSCHYSLVNQLLIVLNELFNLYIKIL